MPPDYEYQPLWLPPGTDRTTAQTVLALHAEYGEWELAKLRVRPDGSRKVVLRRPRSGRSVPLPT